MSDDYCVEIFECEYTECRVELEPVPTPNENVDEEVITIIDDDDLVEIIIEIDD